MFFFFLINFSVEEENPEFWRSQAKKSLQSVLDRKLNTNVAKNIVFFLGDGKTPSLLHTFDCEPHVWWLWLYCSGNWAKKTRLTLNEFFKGAVRKGIEKMENRLCLFWRFVACASGMGLTTITSARILKGQLQNQTGEETVMTMDTFPSVGLVKVKLLAICSEISSLHLNVWKSVEVSAAVLKSTRHCASVRLCSCADVQRGLPDPGQRGHGHRLPVRREDQPQHRRGERGRPQRHLQNSEGQRGHVHPQVGQRRW